MTQNSWINEDTRRMLSDMGTVPAFRGIEKVLSIGRVIPPMQLQDNPVW